MSDHNQTSLLKVWLTRLFTGTLAVIVVGSWIAVGLKLDQRPSWLTMEVALGITAGAVVLVIVVIAIKKATGSGDSGLGPGRPR